MAFFPNFFFIVSIVSVSYTHLIALDGAITLQDAHDVAEKVHNDIEKTFPKVKHIMVHVNPAKL